MPPLISSSSVADVNKLVVKQMQLTAGDDNDPDDPLSAAVVGSGGKSSGGKKQGKNKNNENHIKASYSTPGDHSFVDSVGTSRLTLGGTTNTFGNRVVAPAVNANGTILTTSAGESVEIGREGIRGIVRISSSFAALRL